MPTYKHRKYGISLTVPEGTTDERVGLQMDNLVREHEAKAKMAGQDRDEARAAQGGGPLMGAPEQPMAPPNPLEEMMGMPQAGPGPAQGATIPPGRVSKPTERPWSPLGALLGPREGETMQPFSGAMGDVVREAALPMSLAAGGVPGMAGKAVGAGAAKVLPSLLARGAGRVATLGTGAAMTGAPIAGEEVLRGEDPMTAIKHGGLYGLLGEGAGVVSGKVLGKVQMAIAGRSKGLIPQAVKAQEALVPMGATLTPGQLTTSKSTRLFETIADYGIFSGGRMQKVRDTAHDAAQALLRSHLEDLPVRGGDVVSNAYKDLGARARGVQVDMIQPFLDALNLQMEHQGRIPEVDRIAKWVGDLAAKYPNGKVPFEATARLRSDLLAVERKTMGVLTLQRLSEIAKHNNPLDCWVTISGSVYNLTEWVPDHPGGRDAIISMCADSARPAPSPTTARRWGARRTAAWRSLSRSNRPCSEETL